MLAVEENPDKSQEKGDCRNPIPEIAQKCPANRQRPAILAHDPQANKAFPGVYPTSRRIQNREYYQKEEGD
jgi:hypothetical protein